MPSQQYKILALLSILSILKMAVIAPVPPAVPDPPSALNYESDEDSVSQMESDDEEPIQYSPTASRSSSPSWQHRQKQRDNFQSFYMSEQYISPQSSNYRTADRPCYSSQPARYDGERRSNQDNLREPRITRVQTESHSSNYRTQERRPSRRARYTSRDDTPRFYTTAQAPLTFSFIHNTELDYMTAPGYILAYTTDYEGRIDVSHLTEALYRLESPLKPIFSDWDYEDILRHLRKLQDQCESENQRDLKITVIQKSAIHLWASLGSLHRKAYDRVTNRHCYYLSDVTRTRKFVLEQVEVDDEAFARITDISLITYLRGLCDDLTSALTGGFHRRIYTYLKHLEELCRAEHTPRLEQEAASSEISMLGLLVEKHLSRVPEYESHNPLRNEAIENFHGAVLEQALAHRPRL